MAAEHADPAAAGQDAGRHRLAELGRLRRGAAEAAGARHRQLQRQAALARRARALEVAREIEVLHGVAVDRLQRRLHAGHRAAALGGGIEHAIDGVGVLLRVEPGQVVGGARGDHGGGLVAGGRDDADHAAAERVGEMVAQVGDGTHLAGEHDAAHVVALDQRGDGGRGGLEVLLAMHLDVPRVLRLGQRRPAAGAGARRHLALERELLARPARGERRQARAHAVDEHHQRRHHVLGDAGQRSQIRRAGDHERVLERGAHRQHLAQAGAAGDQRDAAGVGELDLVDESLALGLDPGQVFLGRSLGGRPRLAQMVLEEDAHALALILVGPARVEIHADHRPRRRWQLGELGQARPHVRRRRHGSGAPAPAPHRGQRRLAVGEMAEAGREVLLGPPRGVAPALPLAGQFVLERGVRGVEGQPRRLAEAVGVRGGTPRHLHGERAAGAHAALGPVLVGKSDARGDRAQPPATGHRGHLVFDEGTQRIVERDAFHHQGHLVLP